MAEQLSPAAQAVLDAYRSSHLSIDNLAAALEALADQVVPKEDPPADFLDHAVATEIDQRRNTRAQILAIAAELRGHP